MSSVTGVLRLSSKHKLVQNRQVSLTMLNIKSYPSNSSQMLMSHVDTILRGIILNQNILRTFYPFEKIKQSEVFLNFDIHIKV